LAETGYTLTVEDFDDLSELDRIAGAVSEEAAEFDALPFYVADLPVYPLTIGKIEWLQAAEPWFDNEYEWACAIGMCLTEPSGPALVNAAHDAPSAVRAVRQWRKASGWTPAQLMRAIKHRIKAGDGDGKGGTVAGVLRVLCTEFGSCPDFWLWECDVALVEALLRDWSKAQEKQAQQYRNARDKSPPAPTYRYVAMRKLREKADALRIKWQSKS